MATDETALRESLFEAINARQHSASLECIAGLSDLNFVDAEGQSPLHRAAELENADLCSTLVAHGSHPYMLNSECELPLLVAARKRSPAVTKLLLEHRPRFAPGINQSVLSSIDQTRIDRLDLVHLRDLLIEGLSPNAPFEEGVPAPLFYMSLKRSERAVALLLQFGAATDVMSEKWSRSTVLNACIEASLKNIVWILLQDGADVNDVRDGRSPL